MVKALESVIYRCPICYSTYNEEDEARECIEECTDFDEPEEIAEKTYVCEMCNKVFDNEKEAIGCEKKHEKIKDIYYMLREDEKRRESLRKASTCKNQMKLGAFCEKIV